MDRGTEPYDPDIPEEPDDPEPPPLEIKWERFAILAALLLIMFFLGRVSAPDVVSQERLDQASARLEGAADEIERLQDELRAQPQPTDPSTPEPEPTPTLGAGRVYTVQSGDTMRGIAESFCGDADLDEFVAAFNEIEDPSSISVGMELRIPSDCDL